MWHPATQLGKDCDFAECLTADAWQRATVGCSRHLKLILSRVHLCKDGVYQESVVAECLTLGKDEICWVSFFATAFAECLIKHPLCRMPDFWLSANTETLGKEAFSRSEGLAIQLFTNFRSSQISDLTARPIECQCYCFFYLFSATVYWGDLQCYCYESVNRQSPYKNTSMHLHPLSNFCTQSYISMLKRQLNWSGMLKIFCITESTGWCIYWLKMVSNKVQE